MKGMKIKPGSLGKAAPPYDVQVWWSPFLFAVIIGSEKWESATYSTTFSTIWWYSGLWVVKLLCWLVLEHGVLKMWKPNYPFAYSIADYRWKRQCSASWERRRHCYQNWCQAAIHFFHSIRGKPTVNFLRASSGLQHDIHLYQQEEVQHKRLVALLDLTVLWLQWLFDSVELAKVPMAATCNNSNFSLRRSPIRFPSISHLDSCNRINPKQAAKLKPSPSNLVEGVLTPSAFWGSNSAVSMLLFFCVETLVFCFSHHLFFIITDSIEGKRRFLKCRPKLCTNTEYMYLFLPPLFFIPFHPERYTAIVLLYVWFFFFKLGDSTRVQL